jgi:hypothetical protein
MNVLYRTTQCLPGAQAMTLKAAWTSFCNILDALLIVLK